MNMQRAALSGVGVAIYTAVEQVGIELCTWVDCDLGLFALELEHAGKTIT